MYELIDLKVFYRIAELGSLSAASRELRLPKSSVSRNLERLEKDVGTALFERSTRSLRLTEAGSLLLPHARRILDDVNEAENVLGNLTGEARGTLRVSVPYTFAGGPLAKVLPKFIHKYPNVRIILQVENRMVDLLREDIDVAIRIGPLTDSQMIVRKVSSIDLRLCASPEYLKRYGTPKKVIDLADHNLISHSEHEKSWNLVSTSGKVQEVRIGPKTVVPEPSVVRPLLLEGIGIAFLPEFYAKDCLDNGSLVQVLPDFKWPISFDVHALYPSHRSLSAKVRVFVESLIEHLEK